MTGSFAKRPFVRTQHLVTDRARVESEPISFGVRVGEGRFLQVNSVFLVLWFPVLPKEIPC